VFNPEVTQRRPAPFFMCRNIFYRYWKTEEGRMARMTNKEADYWDEYYTNLFSLPSPSITYFIF
jgi:hypothetical protein